MAQGLAFAEAHIAAPPSISRRSCLPRMVAFGDTVYFVHEPAAVLTSRDAPPEPGEGALRARPGQNTPRILVALIAIALTLGFTPLVHADNTVRVGVIGGERSAHATTVDAVDKNGN